MSGPTVLGLLFIPLALRRRSRLALLGVLLSLLARPTPARLPRRSPLVLLVRSFFLVSLAPPRSPALRRSPTRSLGRSSFIFPQKLRRNRAICSDLPSNTTLPTLAMTPPTIAGIHALGDDHVICHRASKRRGPRRPLSSGSRRRHHFRRDDLLACITRSAKARRRPAPSRADPLGQQAGSRRISCETSPARRPPVGTCA